MKLKLDKVYRIFLNIVVALTALIPAAFLLLLTVCLIIVVFFL